MAKDAAQLYLEGRVLHHLTELKAEIGGTFSNTAPIPQGTKGQVFQEAEAYLETDPANELKVIRHATLLLSALNTLSEDFNSDDIYLPTFGVDA